MNQSTAGLESFIKDQQRWVALALVAVVLLLFYFIAVSPLLGLGHHYEEAIDDLEFRLQRHKKIAAGKDEWMERSSELKLQLESNKQFSSRKTPALASADLQRLLKETVQVAGGQLTSTQVISPRQENSFVRISVKVRMSGTADALRQVFHEIESAKPLLFIDNLDIRPERGRRNRKTRKLEPSGRLNINLEVVSYMRSSNG
ncbi:MAG: type II secretion system protein GspM [Methylococcales bacterium]